ncbi:Concanavalin A-like lectin/glucanases superfamily [Penicillium griseofulvum]|uniref:Concanavalin A-like lectin/glucanases superfamily n=1 Tax=Penicillium patulum TaxID=5078 RepID=A0A135LFK6_PENPA|nr:Concanavalin A-like lectin/glucanases superfamily [Penicillium griseofulvum]KXG47739.1 Concanavalin A-like lectin/glucanases superfamily [Penicillium griseofulvum]
MRINVLALAVAAIYFGTVASSLPDATTPPQLRTKKRPRGCDCYTISGPDPGYFHHYKFWDFRAVDLKKHANLNLSEPIDYSDEDWDDDDGGDIQDPPNDHPPAVHESKDPDPRSLVFYKTSFEIDWSSQNWERRGTARSPVLMINSKHNVFLTRDHEQHNPHATYLVLRTTRFSDYTSTAEIETRLHNIYRCSLRVRFRLLPASSIVSQPPQPKEWPSRDPRRHYTVPSNNKTIPVRDDRPADGACAGIFTYHDQTCESDIEILTRDPSHRVHYANQPDYDFAADKEIPGASTVRDVPVPWTTWSTHRLDWLSNMSRWYVDGQIQDAKSYGVPNLASMIVVNLWSNGGLWTGDMKIGDSIYMGIEYIELVYNRSSDAFGGFYTSPSQNHDGHQGTPLANGSLGNGHSSEPGKNEKCKPGRQGHTMQHRSVLT